MNRSSNKVINAWCMYDWANSVYSLVITTTIFPIYYASITKAAFGSDVVNFLGFQINNTVLYSYSLSFSFLIMAILSPILAGMADYGGRRKRFMKLFTYIGGVSCIMLSFFNGNNLEFGILFSTLASIGFAGSIVFYNAYLPLITSAYMYDRVSARGFSFGYGGSVILLLFSLYLVSNPGFIGLKDAAEVSRVTFILVGIWWISFAQISFYYLPKDLPLKDSIRILLWRGYSEVARVFKSLRDYPSTSRFLLSFFFYNMGVQTVIYMAALFGDEELGLSANELIVTILVIQIVAIVGSLLFAFISERKGNRYALLSMILIWISVCFSAYFIQNKVQFFVLGATVGLVLGGIQSLSRASFSKLIPSQSHSFTSYFSFYDVVEKMSVVLGTLAYGVIEHITGSMRNSSLVLAIFFGLGYILLWSVTIPQRQKE